MKEELSDKKAKVAFVQELIDREYSNVKIIREPADIVAQMNGERFFFEIKKTSADKEYFGAATLTEWRSAYENPDNYFFVVCHEVQSSFSFAIYSPKEFEKFSTIPPFKIFFNIPVNGKNKAIQSRGNKSAIRLTKNRLKKLDELFSRLKEEKSESE